MSSWAFLELQLVLLLFLLVFASFILPTLVEEEPARKVDKARLPMGDVQILLSSSLALAAATN